MKVDAPEKETTAADMQKFAAATVKAEMMLKAAAKKDAEARGKSIFESVRELAEKQKELKLAKEAALQQKHSESDEPTNQADAAPPAEFTQVSESDDECVVINRVCAITDDEARPSRRSGRKNSDKRTKKKDKLGSYEHQKKRRKRKAAKKGAKKAEKRQSTRGLFRSSPFSGR